jgi:TctA family transporter
LGDLVVTLLSGVLGYWMVRCGWPRPPLVLGFVLGRISENFLFISTARYGAAWLVRPMVVLLMLVVIGVAAYPFFQKLRGRPVEAGYAA